MKSSKIFSIAILTFLPTSFSYPQDALKSGNNSIGGSIAYSYSNYSINNPIFGYKTTTNELNFSPSFGSFIADNLLVLINLSYRYSKIESVLPYQTYGIGFQNNASTRNVNFARKFLEIGPILRYYFTVLNVIPFVEAGYSYSHEVTNQQEGRILSFAAGINYFISKSAALEPFMSYLISSYSNPDYDSNIFSFGIRMNYFIVN